MESPILSMSNISEQSVFDTLKYQVEVDKNGMRRYYNKAGQLHRDGGPAIINERRDKYWYQYNRLHRTDGPAIEFADGRKWWYLNDRPLTEAEFNQGVKQHV